MFAQGWFGRAEESSSSALWLLTANGFKTAALYAVILHAKHMVLWISLA